MERIDDLQCKNYRIIQDTEQFCFGMDAVLLANFIANTNKDKGELLDLCCGNGIIPLLLAAKTDISTIYGIEIQEEVAKLARRSVALNKEEDRIHIINGDLRNLDILPKGCDIVSVNPPYMDVGLKNSSTTKQIARHEIMCTFKDVVNAVNYSLKSNGKMFLIHRPNRLVDVVSELRKRKIEPKRLQMVHSYRDKEATLFLMEAVKGAGRELRVQKPLIVYEEDGSYTKQILKMYENDDDL